MLLIIFGIAQVFEYIIVFSLLLYEGSIIIPIL